MWPAAARCAAANRADLAPQPIGQIVAESLDAGAFGTEALVAGAPVTRALVTGRERIAAVRVRGEL
ncbi:hypothetical protein RE6C_02579 [Rhodopirellula europaea 6C]|uniref:Uncharacterized protein n=1 Tax=Rhodopirellula europaea 6C TaxID=1263867 RepID=M2B4H2_9BACT|nr:hypothetical protein RE6C_02579 [Rhodopirellula europaea 6C]